MVSSRERLLEATWKRLGVDVTELEVDASGNVGRTIRQQAMPVPAGGESVDRVEIGEEIGRGGMGVIHRGVQVSLEREVAVKSIRPELGDREAAELLNEARITGALEHPAIVPIYGVSRDADGRPLVLMKHLTGESWHDRIREIGSRRDATLLDDDIGVLIQVCNAVAFAHERSVLHRDIKPANILLGDFGEVYLVDWGLAVDLGGADIPGLPRLDEIEGVSGSLFYMSPEQALGVGEDLGTHTDIYLLGATLYELVTGHPIRGGLNEGKPNFHQLLLRSYSEDAPTLPEWAPPELREICARALAREPGARFKSVRSFRNALSAYLSHRDSRQLEAQAAQRLAAASEAHARGDESDELGGDLAAARFGFEQALRSWPQNRAAQRGRQTVLLLSAEREIMARRPDEAQVMLSLLESERGGSRLSAEISKLRQRLTGERVRAEALEKAAWDSSLGVGWWKLRGYFGLAFGGLLFVAHVVMAVLAHRGTEITHLVYLVATSGIAVVVGLPAAASWRKLVPNRATARFIFTLSVMLVAQVVVFVALWQFGVPLATTLAISLLQLAGSLAIKTSLLDRRALWTAALSLVLGGVAFALPAIAIECVGLAYTAYFITGGLLSFDEGSWTGPALIEDLRRLS